MPINIEVQRVRLESKDVVAKRVLIKPDASTIIYTGTTDYNFIESGATEITVSGNNITIYTPVIDTSSLVAMPLFTGYTGSTQITLDALSASTTGNTAAINQNAADILILSGITSGLTGTYVEIDTFTGYTASTENTIQNIKNDIDYLSGETSGNTAAINTLNQKTQFITNDGIRTLITGSDVRIQDDGTGATELQVLQSTGGGYARIGLYNAGVGKVGELVWSLSDLELNKSGAARLMIDGTDWNTIVTGNTQNLADILILSGITSGNTAALADKVDITIYNDDLQIISDSFDALSAATSLISQSFTGLTNAGSGATIGSSSGQVITLKSISVNSPNLSIVTGATDIVISGTPLTFENIGGAVSGNSSLVTAFDLKVDNTVYNDDLQTISETFDIIITDIEQLQIDVSGITGGSYNFIESGATQIEISGSNVTIYTPVVDTSSFVAMPLFTGYTATTETRLEGIEIDISGNTSDIATNAGDIAYINGISAQNIIDIQLVSGVTSGHTIDINYLSGITSGNTIAITTKVDKSEYSGFTGTTNSNINYISGVTSGNTAAIVSNDNDINYLSGITSGNTNDITAIQQQFVDVENPTGFINNENIEVYYDEGTETITLSATTGTLDYYYEGVKGTLGTSWTSDPHPSGGTTWYLYANTSAVDIQWSNIPWTFKDLIVGSTTAGKPFSLREVHGVMQPSVHQTLHNTIGTYKVAGGGFTVGTYVVQPASPTDADNTVGLESVVIADEDVNTSLEAWIQGSYTNLYFTTTGVSVLTTGNTSYAVITGTYPNYYTWNGSTFTTTQMVSNRYANYYVLRIPIANDISSRQYRAIVVSPQFQYTSLATALTENPQTLWWGDFSSVVEGVLVEKITIRTNNAYGSTGRFRIEALNVLSGSRFSQISTTWIGGTTTAGNVSVTPTTPFTSIDLQAQSSEYADYMLGLNDDIAYISGVTSGLTGSYLPLSGGTLTGNLTISKTGATVLAISGTPTGVGGININNTIGFADIGFLDIGTKDLGIWTNNGGIRFSNQIHKFGFYDHVNNVTPLYELPTGSPTINQVMIANATGGTSWSDIPSDSTKADKTLTIVYITGATTLDSTYNGKMIEANGTFTLTFTTGLVAGWNVSITNIGSGTITLDALGTLQSKNSAVTIVSQYGGVVAYSRGSDIILIVGDLA